MYVLNRGTAIARRTLTGFGIAAFCLALPVAAQAGPPLTRLAVSVQSSGPIDAASTDTPASGGIKVYDQTVKVPASDNVLYVNVSGLSHGSNPGAINCQVDSTNCISTTNSFLSKPGWLSVGNDQNETTYGENSITYTFCVPIVKGTHTVTINVANATGVGDAYFEQMTISVDANKIQNHANACSSF